MSQYYLMAQLPSLDALTKGSRPPISEEKFLELCEELLPQKSLKALRELSLLPKKQAERTGNSLLDAWLDGERELRIALGTVRAEKMQKQFDTSYTTVSAQAVSTARLASDAPDPMSAEILLADYRLSFLESLRPQDWFCEDAVFYYGIKLMLLWRLSRFDSERGESAYRKIYNSVLNADRG